LSINHRVYGHFFHYKSLLKKIKKSENDIAFFITRKPAENLDLVFKNSKLPQSVAASRFRGAYIILII